MSGRAAALILVVAAMMGSAGETLGQGFAGLGSDAQGFAIPERGQELSFPRDHGAHPEYRIECGTSLPISRGRTASRFGLPQPANSPLTTNLSWRFEAGARS